VQERILLCLVESVDFVDKQDRPRPGTAGRSAVENDTNLFDTGVDGTELDKCRVGMVGHEAGKRGLSAARGSPEYHGRDSVTLDEKSKGLTSTEEMLLPDKLGEGLRPDTFCERDIFPHALPRSVTLKQVHYCDGAVR
jgi:hypothetical protein